MANSVRQVGVLDPERRTSPVYEPGALNVEDEVVDWADLEASAAVCYFNDEAFPHGSEIESGGSILRCEHGNWVVSMSPSQ